jgi:hypothetical protein
MCIFLYVLLKGRFRVRDPGPAFQSHNRKPISLESQFKKPDGCGAILDKCWFFVALTVL